MERYKKTKRASILGILGNIILAIIKGIIGFMTGSQAMISDFFNSATDIFNSALTFVGNTIASKPSDEDHNLGHGKAEYIYSLIISIVLILTSLVLLKDSIETIINGKTYNYSFWLIVVCIITIIVKFCLFIYTNFLSKKYHNLLLKANSMDHRNDIFLTLLTLLSVILTSLNVKYIDGIVGAIIAGWIFYTALKLFKESYDVLMDKAISKEVKEEVLSIIKNHPEVKKINHFNSTPVGYKYQINFTIFVDGDLSTFESHDIADTLEKEITKQIDEVYLTIIHVNPIKITKLDK